MEYNLVKLCLSKAQLFSDFGGFNISKGLTSLAPNNLDG